jgi:type IV pilus biogenesis protein CpaD/CtpE
MKKIKVTLMPMLLLMTGLSLSSCATFYDDNLGSKVASNKSAQVINPDAVTEEASVATLEGQKAEKLLKRYRTEKADAPTEKLLKDLGD